MKSVAVLGAGLMGRPMALDLAQDPDIQVTVADISTQALAQTKQLFERSGKNVPFTPVHLRSGDPRLIRSLAYRNDLVINAVPGDAGYATLEAIIDAGRNAIDISFSPEDPFALDHLAKQRGVTAVVDCGLAPGMSHMIVGHVDSVLDKIEEVRMLVGGLPAKRGVYPHDFKTVFSPIDVLAEYTRPARMKESGEIVTRPALSDPEDVEFRGVGMLEAFNTDGLRTLLQTMEAPYMHEKTLRYPGHRQAMEVLRDTGCFDPDMIAVTAQKLFPRWRLEDTDDDITIMRVEVYGSRGDDPVQYTYDLFDRRDQDPARIHSMARTTGYTATLTARLLLSEEYTKTGIIPPEYIGKDPDSFAYIWEGLLKRGVRYTEKVEDY